MPTSPTNRLLPALRRVVLVRETADRTDGQLLTAFLLERDGDAFAALVRRHGPMVLGVARRVIGDPHTADDAFQAVFLVLARRAGAVRPREQVGNWLYGVAYRTAMKARAVLARRRSREKQVDAMPEPPAKTSADSWSDLQPLIDEELARLPDKLRLPVVLCDLEGRPQRAVATHLGIAPATLAARLAAARRLLAGRLSRRGVRLSGGALAMVLGERASAAMVTPTLAASTVRAAEAIAAGTGTSGLTGLVSAHALHLSEGVMRIMMLSKLKTAALATLVAFALTGGVGFGLMPAQAGDSQASGGDEEKGRKGEKTVQHPASSPRSTLTDAEFLRRLCLDLTGLLPNRIELNYFTTDTDAKKHAKVIDWLIADEGVKTYLAKKLSVPVENIHIVRAADGNGHAFKLIVVRPVRGEAVRRAAIDALAFSPDGKRLATGVADGTVRVWDAQSGKLLLAPAVLGQGVAVADFDNDGYADLLIANEWLLDGKQTARVNVNQLLTEWIDVGAADPPVVLWDLIADPPAVNEAINFRVRLAESDTDFLKRATHAARGTAPTALEEKYFADDKDQKKREKLFDLLLKDPVVAKKLGDEWKKKMLESPRSTVTRMLHEKTYREHLDIPLELTLDRPENLVVPLNPYRVVKTSKFDKLVDELIAAKKSDEQILEAIALAAAGRLPTGDEKKATLAVIGTLTDKKAAWVAIAKALTPPK